MDFHLSEWLGLCLRWFHLIAGISWIGSSFYFMWLDSNMVAPDPSRPGVEGDLWMVHSGGFYQVEKRRIGPGQMPKVLHWFKWEAAFTWLSGIFLLGVVYYLTGGVFLIDPGTSAHLTPGSAIGLSLGVIIAAWLIYDGLWMSPLADKAPRLTTAISLAGLVGAMYGLCQVFSGRAAYIHVGAMLGTLMVANVWMRILPAQQKMIDATEAGKQPDFSHGLRAKRRSVHNSYVTFPVIFMMISNHYPVTYGHPYNWLVLLLMFCVGAGIRHMMILRSKGSKKGDWGLAAGLAALAAVVYMTAEPGAPKGEASASVAAQVPVAFSDVLTIVQHRCQPCHSQHPTDDIFKSPPNGAVFETAAQLKAYAGGIRERVFVTKTMPLANKTGITDAERETIGHWVEQGAKVAP